MEVAEFTEQFTAKTFTNEDGDRIVIRQSEGGEFCEIDIEGNVFWFSKGDAEKLCRGITEISGGL